MSPAAADDTPSLHQSTAGRILRPFTFAVFLGALLVAGLAGTVRLNLQAVVSQSSPGTQTTVFEGDTWWHVTTGQRILQSHAWPTQETDSFTARGAEWIAYEWLGDVALAAAERLGGVRGLAVLLMALASTILLLTYYLGYLRSCGAQAAFLTCILLSPLLGVSFSLRPQLFGYIFFLITLICLERFRLGRMKHLWLLPFILLLWVNTHPTFVYGFLLIALYWVCGQFSFSAGGISAERWTPREGRHLTAVGLCCLLTLPLNPYGYHLPAYLLRIAFDQPLNLANVQEWRPLPLDAFYGKLFLALVLGFILAVVALRPAYRLQEIVLLLGALWMACLHLRFLILFAIIFAPILAALLARWTPAQPEAPNRAPLNAALVLVLAVGSVLILPSRRLLDAAIARCFPVAAVDYLRAHPIEAPMFNDYPWGAFLTRSLGAAHPVFIDGRADAYEPAGVLADYLRIVHLNEDPLPILARHGVGACLISPGQPLAIYLAASPDWQKVYADDLSVIYVHNFSGNK